MIKVTGNIQTLTNMLNAFKKAPNRDEEEAAKIILGKVRVTLC
jgi:hypothetical protein